MVRVRSIESRTVNIVSSSDSLNGKIRLEENYSEKSTKNNTK